jgi:hypothetical protein
VCASASRDDDCDRFDGASLKARPTHVRASLGIAHVVERRRVFPPDRATEFDVGGLAFGSEGSARENLGTSVHAVSTPVGVQEPARTYPFRRRAADACSWPRSHGASTAAPSFTFPRKRPAASGAAPAAAMREEKAPPSRKSTEAAVVCQSSDAAFHCLISAGVV